VFHDRPKYIEIKHYILRDKVKKREVVLQYISTDKHITNIFGKASVQDEKFVYSRDKLGLMETTSLLKKEVITPKLGGSIDMLLIYGQSFFQFENGPGWVVPLQFGKWFEISDGHAFSSS
jgi:hypothetical protein